MAAFVSVVASHSAVEPQDAKTPVPCRTGVAQWHRTRRLVGEEPLGGTVAGGHRGGAGPGGLTVCPAPQENAVTGAPSHCSQAEQGRGVGRRSSGPDVPLTSVKLFLSRTEGDALPWNLPSLVQPGGQEAYLLPPHHVLRACLGLTVHSPTRRSHVCSTYCGPSPSTY